MGEEGEKGRKYKHQNLALRLATMDYFEVSEGEPKPGHFRYSEEVKQQKEHLTDFFLGKDLVNLRRTVREASKFFRELKV